MSFLRKKGNYYYLVESIWTAQGPRQKVLQYFGKKKPDIPQDSDIFLKDARELVKRPYKDDVEKMLAVRRFLKSCIKTLENEYKAKHKHINNTLMRKSVMRKKKMKQVVEFIEKWC